MVVKQEIFFEDTETLIADAKITFVIIDKKTNKPMVINQELQEVLSMNKIVN
jgi:acyl-CoA thioesterase FadM